MARWTGKPEITAILQVATAWRDRCLLADGSVLSDEDLWTSANLEDLLERYVSHPIEGTSRDFLDKLQEQLAGAPAQIVHLAAEALWFLFLFPARSAMKPETKRQAIATVWSWAGEPLPASASMDDEHLMGVGNPGTAYLTLRPQEFEYILRVCIAIKALGPAERSRLLTSDAWAFGTWLDSQPNSDRRLARNAFLYFLFPDSYERILSRGHRQQIYQTYKARLLADQRISPKDASLLDYDRALYAIRQSLEKEAGTSNVDFYDDAHRAQWQASFDDARRKNFVSWLDTYLTDRGLRLNQSGRDTSVEKLRKNQSISAETGYWSDGSGLTAKPPRWLLHFDLTTGSLAVSVPPENRARVIGFANTKGGDSGALAVRIMPVARVAEGHFEPIDQWEWLFLLCFSRGLKPGSAAQAFDDFDPATGVLTYMGEQVPYIFSALMTLNSPDEPFSTQVAGQMKSITYKDATDALLAFLKVTSGGLDA